MSIKTISDDILPNTYIVLATNIEKGDILGSLKHTYSILILFFTFIFIMTPVFQLGTTAIGVYNRGLITECTDIREPGHYFFSRNISGVQGNKYIYLDWSWTPLQYCIGVFADNVIIDGDGFSIKPGEPLSIGVFVSNVSNIVIRNLTVEEGWISAVLENVVNPVLEHNLFIGAPVRLDNTFNATIVFNSFVQTGLDLEESFRNTVLNNTVNGKPIIYLENESNQLITGDVGQVFIINSTSIAVRNASLSQTVVGILIYSSNNVLIDNIIVNEVHKGVKLIDASNNVIKNSYYTKVLSGIVMERAHDNIVFNNTFSDYDFYGIYLKESTSNLFFLNEFLIGYQHVKIVNSPSNRWYSPEPITYIYYDRVFTNYLGNYWRYHDRTDYDGDGLADSPYVIDEDNVDKFPLFATREKYKISPEFSPVIATCTNIYLPGYYILGSDLHGVQQGENFCIGIYASDVILDGNGFVMMSSNNRASLGIQVWGASNVTIRNFEIRGYGIGIGIFGSQKITIANNRFIDSGIYLRGSAILGNLIVNNTVNGKKLLYLENKTNLALEGIDVGQLILVNSSNVTIQGLDISNTTVGISLIRVYGVVVRDSVLTHNVEGIMVEGGGSITIEGNKIEENLGGLALTSVSYANVSRNVIVDNKYAGIILWHSMRLELFNNTIKGANCGLVLYVSDENTFYLNDFSNEKNVCFVEGSLNNTWRSREPLRYIYKDVEYAGHLGNYWSDYTGLDGDGDGVGDTPYVIFETISDPSPLMTPRESYILKGNQISNTTTHTTIMITTELPTITPPTSETHTDSSEISLRDISLYALVIFVTLTLLATINYLSKKR